MDDVTAFLKILFEEIRLVGHYWINNGQNNHLSIENY